jgi:predicted O-methyltransferase YrrM
MDIVAPQIDEYLHRITPSRTAVIQEMEALAVQNNFPIVGPLVGRILYQFSALLKAQRVLELGSGYGYSAMWWCLGSPNAKVECTEGSAENIRKGEDFLRRAGFGDRVRFHLGDALQTVEKLDGEFDIIFMDIDKHQYPEGFRKAYPRLRKGGLFITDNVLWSGRIVEGDQSPATLGIVEYNRLIYSTPGAFSTILPVRDGVAVTYKQDS